LEVVVIVYLVDCVLDRVSTLVLCFGVATEAVGKAFGAEVLEGLLAFDG
jgi:hypothetical protein